MNCRPIFALLLFCACWFPGNIRAQTPAPPNHVLELDGTNSYVELPANLFTNEVVTVEGWLKWQAFANHSRFVHFADAARHFSIMNRGTNGTLWLEQFARPPFGDLRTTSVPEVLSLGEWHHIAAVVGPNGIRVYLNGGLVSTSETPNGWSPIPPPPVKNLLGRSLFKDADNAGNDADFNGQMDEVRIWAGERTEAQIRETMLARLNGNETNLLALWNFDDLSDPGRDASAGGHHGRLAGNARVVVVHVSLAPSGLSSERGSVLTLAGNGSYLELPRELFKGLSEGTVEGWVKWHSFVRLEHVFEFEATKTLRLGSASGRADVDLAAWTDAAPTAPVRPQVPDGARDSVMTLDAHHGGEAAARDAAQQDPSAPANTNPSISRAGVLRLNQWHHLAAAFDGTGMRLYVDGNLMGTAPYTSGLSPGSDTSRYFLGTCSVNPANSFHGQLDEFRVWKVALTEAQIRENRSRSLTGKETGLAALWNFDDPAGPGQDASPGSHHARVMGNARVGSPTATVSLPPIRSNESNRVLSLDGTNSFVELPADAFTNLTEATVEGWVKWDEFRMQSRFFDFNVAAGWWSVRNDFSRPNLNLSVIGAQGGERIVITNALQAGEWVHIASTITPTSRRLYVNGVLVGSQPQRYAMDPSRFEKRNYLGRSAARLAFTNNADFSGQLAEVRVWNVERSAEEIRTAMNTRLTGSESNLVALWNFDDPANPGRDASPNGHHGTLMGNARVVPAADRVRLSSVAENLVLTLDGESSLVTAEALVPTTGEYTVECWGFADASASGAFRHLLDQDRQFYLGMKPEGAIRVGDSWEDTGVPYPYGGWHHFAVVKHSAGAELYIDGVLAAKSDRPLRPPTDITTFRIGQNRYGGERWLGFIDEVRAWNVARTAEQIRENYMRNLEGTEPGLVGLWNFDDPANPGRDRSPGGHHGQLVGNPRVVAENRPGVMETAESAITVVDEPLTNLVPVQQRVANLLRLDGDNGAMMVETLAGFDGGNESHTVEAWLRPHSAPPVRGWPLLLGRSGPGAGSHHWLLHPDGRTRLGRRMGQQVTSGLSFGEWTHVATTWDSTNGVYTVYLNGQAVGTTPAQSVQFDLQGVPLWIGRRELNPGSLNDSNFQGDIAEVRVWNRARTREEIREDLSGNVPVQGPGLTGLWSFSDPAHPGKDSTTNRNDGVLTRGAQVLPIDTPLPPEETGTEPVLALDGNGSYVELPPNIFNGLTEATVEGWVRWRAFGGDSRFFDFGKVWQTMAVSQTGDAGTLRFEIWEPGRVQRDLRGTNVLGLNQWTHIAAVSGSNGMRLYRNGDLVASNGFAASFAAVKNGDRNYLGRNNWFEELNWVRDLNGLMDEVRVWRTARTETQIREAMFQKLTGREAGLFALWNFDQVTNNVVPDLSPNAHHGKLIGNARMALARLPLLNDRSVMLHGKIIGVDGKPAVGAEVTVFADGVEVQRGISQPAGQYRLRFPTSAGSLRIVGSLSNTLAIVTVPRLTGGEQREVNLTMLPPGSVLGRVTDVNGQPLAAVQVQLFKAEIRYPKSEAAGAAPVAVDTKETLI